MVFGKKPSLTRTCRCGATVPAHIVTTKLGARVTVIFCTRCDTERGPLHR